MSLAAPDRRLVRLSAAIALGRWDELRALRHAAPPGEPDRRWREVLLQSHLFAGFPRTVEAAGVLAAAGGLGAPEADETDEEAHAPDPAAGEALFDAIYGARAAAVRAELAGGHPLLARWIAEHAYARVLARPGLAPDRRELCAVAALAVQGQERQLASHARGAVRLGATPGEVVATLEELAPWMGADDLARAREVVAHFGR
ncbi:MAG TPA: carboxymuconolactone decarboxylase family protein [Planctomycetota bacterium]